MAAMFKLWHLPLLFGTGLVAGFVDAIAGGGGLITLPVLLSFGLDPRHALGTNKLQATFGSASASWHYAQAKTIPLKGLHAWFPPIAPWSGPGSVGGAAD